MTVVTPADAQDPAIPDSHGGPTGAIDQREIDAETEAETDLDAELEESFPSSDPPSSWAGADEE
jgi:hypothetical protein